jgi:hypothetical protein
MQTVHGSFKGRGMGTQHTNPDMMKEVDSIAKYMVAQKLHVHMATDCPGNNFTSSVIDLLADGARYPHTKKAFHNFLKDPQRYTNMGVSEGVLQQSILDLDEEDEEKRLAGVSECEYEVSRDDLAHNSEEFPEWEQEFIAASIEMVNSLGV